MSTDTPQTSPTRSESKHAEQDKQKGGHTRIVIDPDGDLCLIVGDEDATAFVVCSKTVARASPVWKRLLFGLFSESLQPSKDSGEEWTVRLPVDNPRSMRLVLNIIHSQFEEVPTSVTFFDYGEPGEITFEELFQLTVLTDKYDLTRIIRPWASNWLRDIDERGPLAAEYEGNYPATDTDRLCWVAWELGSEEILTKAIKKIAKKYVKVEGSLKWDPHEEKLFTLGREPANLYSLVESHREEMIRKMLGPVNDAVAKLLVTDAKIPICTEVTDLSDRTDCETTMLGAIIRSLNSRFLWPIPNSQEAEISASNLAENLKRLNTCSLLEDHGCEALPNIKSTVDTALKDISLTLPDAYIRHLKAQAGKLGTDLKSRG